MWMLGFKGLTRFAKRGDEILPLFQADNTSLYLSFEFDHAKKNITNHVTLSRHIQ